VPSVDLRRLPEQGKARDVNMASAKKCSLCNKKIGGGKLGMLSHWGMHRRKFHQTFDRDAMNNDELRAWMNGNMGFF